MGLQRNNFMFIEFAYQYFGNSFANLRMLEYGNQHIGHQTELPEDATPELCEAFKNCSSGKEFFETLGVKHTSVDINGQDGALVLDLSKPLNKPEWIGSFDIVTNFGTVEHIDQDGFRGQYEAFKTLHECLRVNGLTQHIMPMHGYYRKHCKFHYKLGFFIDLAAHNNYEIAHLDFLDVDESKRKIRAIGIKKENNPFMSWEAFSRLTSITRLS